MEFSLIEDAVSLDTWAASANANANVAPDASLHCDARHDATSMVDLDRHCLEIRQQELTAGAA